MNESPQGKIITFYSYKGGTGRSMALANAACWLTRRSPSPAKSVLMMDWDLEAPGLHRYFEAQSEHPEDFDRPGVIDYFVALRDRLDAEPGLYERLTSEDGPELMRREFPLGEYLIGDVVAGADFIRAGKLDAKYAEQVSTFDWVYFYKKYGGALEPFREMLASAYPYVLIDSRTGFNDVSGVCTMLLPETLVMVFTPNRQSVSGVIDLATRATDYRRASNDFRALSVFPLPSRIENAELALKREWRRQYQQEFEGALRNIYQLETCDLTNYFDEVQLPQVAYYAYGEKIALLEERSDALSLGRAYEVFFRRLTGLDFAWDTPAEIEAETAATATPRPVDETELAESDIYISYAHIDNQPLAEGMRGWVDMLQERLNIRLKQLLGRGVKIWRDPKLQGNDIFPDTIFLTLSKATLFVPILSPRYVKSEWCMRELSEFAKLAASKGGASQFFKVVKIHVPEEEVPEALRGLLGYHFYELDERGRFREFHQDVMPDKDQRYWEKLEDLAQDIAHAIMRRESGVELSVASAPIQAAVYLAETTADLREERDKIKNELRQHGVLVLPDKALPITAPELDEEVRAYLRRCSLSVHLIGERYGLIPEGEDRSIVELQSELAAAERSADPSFKGIVWMPPGLMPGDERQRLFVESLENDPASQDNMELLQGAVEYLKDRILTNLQQRAAPPAKAGTPDRPTLVYMIYDRVDADAARPLEDYLFNRGYEVLSPLFEGDEAELAQLHKENLMSCDAVMILYGQTSHIWVQMKLREMLKLAGYGRSEPILAKAVYLGPPGTSPKEQFRTHETIVIKNFGDFSPDSLAPFIAMLNEAKRTRGPA